MITALRLSNFKRFADQVLDLRPRVIVLVGPNSSGKSSLLKSLLAFKQTYEDQTDHSGFLSKGAYVDVGPYDEYVRNHNSKQKCSLSFSLKAEERGRFGYGLQNFRSAKIQFVQEEDPQTGHGRLFDYTLSLPHDPDDEYYLVNSEFSDYQVRFTRMQKSEEAYRVSISRGLFDSVIGLHRQRHRWADVTYDQLKRALNTGSVQALRHNENGMMLSHHRATRYEVTDIVHSIAYGLVTRFHSQFYHELRENTFALAALRVEPQRSSPRTDEKTVVGSRGENATAVYNDFRQRAVKAGKRNARVKDDFGRLSEWVSNLRLSNELKVSRWRDLVDLRLTVGSNRSAQSVADVGVGFSQAFPILVQLAVMPPGGRLILEQPELHLYPWAQRRFGEILCDEAHRANKQMIIETHSEHIIRGIQTHVSRAQISPSGSLGPDEVAVYYVDENGKVIPLRLNEFGEFMDEWPAGFFDQGLVAFDEIFRNRELAAKSAR